MGTPGILRNLAMLLLVGLAGALMFLFLVPWVQTAQGMGQVTALDPRDRVQTITALVPGRIAQWYVTEGAMVKEGDPIARLTDNDPQLLDRLRAERAQVEADIAAAGVSQEVAERDVRRLSTLVAEGLVARQDLEAAQIKVSDYRSKVAQTRAKLTAIDISLNRQSAQIVEAPRDGQIQQILAGDKATMVSAGDVLATFAPSATRHVVELHLDGRDIPLVHPGRRVRLEFEGWPAVQFSGWPSVSRGMFDGEVRTVDAAASANGLYRILVVQSPDRPPWPTEPSVRLGAKVRGWVLLDTVRVGYELWRQLNNFPLQNSAAQPGAPTSGMGRGAPKGSDKDSGGSGKASSGAG
jgi:RND family efflux transporter MFP subunit